MSTTFVPKWDEPIYMTMEQVREMIRQTLVEKQGDNDKAGDIEDAVYYQGGVDVCNDFLFSMTFPRREEDARECVHAVMVWWDHPCEVCRREGYVWAEVPA
jgi:hypothetical protein